MLSISAMTGAGQGKYYLNLAREDYYLGGGEPPGRWLGKGAEILGLEGKVERESFRHLLLGRSPDGSRDLVQNAGKENRQSGWDLTFSAPKSVSIMFAFAPDIERDVIRAAHAVAVAKAMAFLESDAAFTRRGTAGKEREKVGLVVAAFEHATSRALDPNLHTHALVCNVCTRADGTSGTILSRPLYQMKMEAGAVYRRELARELEANLQLKIVWKPRQMFEVAGVPQTLVNVFSKRRSDIKRVLTERGLDSAVAAKIAALDTRPKKKLAARNDLFAAWEKVARQHGFGREQVTQLLRGTSKEKQREETRSAGNKPSPEPRPDTSNFSKPQKTKTHMDPEPNSREQSRRDENRRTRGTASESERDQGRKQERSKDRVLFRIPVLGVPVRVVDKKLFPNAPSWSPAKKLTLPRLVVGEAKGKAQSERKKSDTVIRKKALGPIELQLRERRMFPNAPAWSPASKLKTKTVAVRSRLRESIDDMSERRRKASARNEQTKRDSAKDQSRERSR